MARMQAFCGCDSSHSLASDRLLVNASDANMYLAEDRILCWELVSKRNSNWTLHYVKSARAITDVPDGVAELISQRRRWLNGSFFAAIHSTVKFGYLYRSSCVAAVPPASRLCLTRPYFRHSFGRKLFLHIELLYREAARASADGMGR